LKVSKPVIFALVFAVGVVLYLFVFSGKKTPPAPASKPQAGQLVQPQPQGAAAGLTGAQQPLAGSDNAKLRSQVYTQLKSVEWARDPFAFPGYIEQKRNEQTKGHEKLVAIIEGRKGNIAIIDNEIFKKGDMIGNEKIQEIGDGKIVLVNKGVKRVITIEEAPATDIEIKVKKRGK
jgi:hypothetical protein